MRLTPSALTIVTAMRVLFVTLEAESWNVKSLAFARLLSKRLKGLEPSTFCMASRRSSQLSYIREVGQV